MSADLFKDSAQRILKSLNTRQPEILSQMKALVEAESPSGDVAGSREVVGLLSTLARNLACVDTVEQFDSPGGQHLVVHAYRARGNAGNIMIVGHTDTVHERGSLAINPWRIESGRVYGPGIFDMKANCVMALEALRVLTTSEVNPECAVTLVLTCDEEVGSYTGWPLLKRLADELTPRCAFILEPSANGSVKTERKGTAMFSLKVYGVAAHAGLDPEKGASAILELAKQIERLHEFNNSANGITVNVGVVQGGTRSNVVAAEAAAEIDVRFSTAAESEIVKNTFLNLPPFDARVKLEVTGEINRPPLERTAQVSALFEKARAVAATIGFELGETRVGGASDGNFLAALGIPVLDGLGIDGDGAHATHEHVLADAIARRTALLAGLIATA